MSGEPLIRVAQTLDEFIAEEEIKGEHTDGSTCEYRLNRGQPLSSKRCQMCLKLSPLIDLSVSWTQKIDTGRLAGRSIEIVETPGVRTIRDAETTWKLYRECDRAQRESQQCLLRRYYASFTCGTGHYMLRDVTTNSLPPLDDMTLQLADFFQCDGLPRDFIHGNPTVTSLSFIGRLPVPLKKYNSRYLLQIDYGAGDSAALTALGLREDITRGAALIVDPSRNTIRLRKDATFANFLADYTRHWKVIGLFLMLRGLLSLYPPLETRDYVTLVGRSSSARNLIEAFEEMKEVPITLSLQSALYDVHKKRNRS